MLSQYRGLRKENYILCFGRLVTAMGSMVWPMLTMILNQKMGVRADYVAWIMSAIGIVSLPANLIGGKMADRFNKKMNIIWLDLISVTCYIICAAIPLSAASIVLMSVASTCQNMEHSSYNALIADLNTSKDRARAYSLQYLGGNLGFVLSPVIAGFLFKNYLWLAFLISGTSIGCSAILIFVLVKDITPEEDVSCRASYQADRNGESLWAVLKENKIVILYILIVGGYYAIYQMYHYLTPLDLGRVHGDNGAMIYGSITSVNCVVVVIFTPLLTKLFPKLSEPVKTVAGQILQLAGFAVFLLFMGKIPFYYLAMVILTWGEVFMVLAESPYLSNRMPASHRGRINGLSTVVRTGITSGFQMLVGSIYAVRTSAETWIFVLAVGVFFVLLSVVLVVKDRKAYENLYR